LEGWGLQSATPEELPLAATAREKEGEEMGEGEAAAAAAAAVAVMGAVGSFQEQRVAAVVACTAC
jgi:hypothetical protein